NDGRNIRTRPDDAAWCIRDRRQLQTCPAFPLRRSPNRPSQLPQKSLERRRWERNREWPKARGRVWEQTHTDSRGNRVHPVARRERFALRLADQSFAASDATK